MESERGKTGPKPKSKEELAAALPARVWAKVNKDGPGGCWLWNGSKNPQSGNAMIGVDGKAIKASVVIWEMLKSAIPEGCFLNRTCKTPECTNPDHHEVSPERRARNQGEARVTVICPIDGKAFDVFPSAIARGGGKYCCRACKSEGLRREVEATRAQQPTKPAPSLHETRSVFDLAPGPYRKRSLRERFEEKVNPDGPIPAHRPDLGPCAVWTASRDRNGYGQFRIGRQTFLAHRVAYELDGETIPSGLQVLHHCDNGPGGCVRRSHLFLGTPADNTADMVSKGRQRKGPNPPGVMPHGAAHHATNLTDALVEEMLQLHAQGWSRGELAEKYGISAPTCGDILRGKSWKHIKRPEK
jgi:hypothetical protein